MFIIKQINSTFKSFTNLLLILGNSSSKVEYNTKINKFPSDSHIYFELLEPSYIFCLRALKNNDNNKKKMISKLNR